MKTDLRTTLVALAACCCAAISLPAAAAGTVSVSFIAPETFSDAGRGPDREHDLGLLARTLQTSAAAVLAEGETLDVTVLDVDLAGREDPFAWGAGGRELRVLHGGADWPRIELRYTLRRGDSVLRSGEARVSDMSYLQNLPRSSAGQPLYHERHMLEEWVQAQFGSAQVVGR